MTVAGQDSRPLPLTRRRPVPESLRQVTFLSYFPAGSRPESPAEFRLRRLAEGLSNHFRVRLVTLDRGDAPPSNARASDTLEERRFPKTREYQLWHNLLEKMIRWRSCSGPVSAIAGRRHRAFRRALAREAAEADVLWSESPYPLALLPRRRRKRQLLVYSVQMVEADAAGEMFPGRNPAAMAMRRWVRRIERQAIRRADLVIAQGIEQVDRLREYYPVGMAKVLIAPNGINRDAIPPCPSNEVREHCRDLFGFQPREKVVLFNGWPSGPNEQAVQFLIHQLAVECPSYRFVIAGHVSRLFLDDERPPNIQLFGWMDFETTKRMLYAADAAILPMATWGQNWSELLEYLSAGLPVLATPEAVEGLELEHRRHLLVYTRDELARGLHELLQEGRLARLFAREGRRLIEERFAWEHTFKLLRETFSTKLAPRLLILNDYAVTPAEQGGQVRIESVARCLEERGIATTLLTLKVGGEEERRQVGPLSEEINIPRGMWHRVADRLLEQRLGCGADDTTGLLLTPWLSPRYLEVLRAEQRLARGIMLSHPYMQSSFRRLRTRLPLYYDSHNTEFELKKAIYPKGLLSRRLINAVRRAELAAAGQSKATFCVSDSNRRELSTMVPGLEKRAFVCPNGVDARAACVRTRDDKKAMRRRLGMRREFMAIFVGSGHPPNAEAARFILGELSRYHARVLYVLVGTVNGWFHNQPLPANVLFTGPVPTPVKNTLLSLADFALNPMLTGSGTSLKMMDYMAAGLPILSTAVGARGLSDEELAAIALMEPSEFRAGISRLLADPAELDRLAAASRRLALERYDWPIALGPMLDAISRDFAGRRPYDLQP